MWDQIREVKPLLGITVMVLVPYGLYVAYLFVCLQHPAWWARVALTGTMTKFCIRGLEGEVQRPFVVVASALFPHHDFATLSCIEAMGYYVDAYHRAMLTATHTGTIDTLFPVEGATPCQVATRAGFFARAEDGYPQQIHDHLVQSCRDDEDRADAASSIINAAHRPMVSTQNHYNQGQLSLD